MEAYTIEEVLQIIESSKEDIQLHTMIMLSIHTGMRAEEVLALRWNDIDEAHMKIKVDEAQTTHYEYDENFQKKGSRAIEAKTKTKKSTRKIKVPKEVFELLEGWKEVAPQVSKTRFGKNDFVFGSKRSSRLEYSGYRQRAIKFFKKCYPELGNFKLHRLRHMAATFAAMKEGVSIEDISEMLGHSRLSTTKRYISTNEEMIARATNGVSEVLKSLQEKKGKKFGE